MDLEEGGFGIGVGYWFGVQTSAKSPDSFCTSGTGGEGYDQIVLFLVGGCNHDALPLFGVFPIAGQLDGMNPFTSGLMVELDHATGVLAWTDGVYFHQSGILPAPSIGGMRILILSLEGWTIQAVASGIFISSPGWTS